MRTHVHGSEGIVKRESHIDRKKSKKGKKTSNDSRDGKKDEARDAEKSREKSSWKTHTEAIQLYFKFLLVLTIRFVILK